MIARNLLVAKRIKGIEQHDIGWKAAREKPVRFGTLCLLVGLIAPVGNLPITKNMSTPVSTTLAD